MGHLDCIVVPNNKKGSVYACAAQAGIKVRTQSNPDGQGTTVWRISDGAPELRNQDRQPGPASTPYPTSTYVDHVLTPEGEFPSGRYVQADEYSPRVWMSDLDERGRPVNLHKKSKQLKDILS
jgi:hypothetical protein